MASSSSQPQEGSTRAPPSRSWRSVADFVSDEALRKALTNCRIENEQISSVSADEDENPHGDVSGEDARGPSSSTSAATIPSSSNGATTSDAGDPPSPDLDWVVDNPDPLTSRRQSFREEAERLKVLKSYGILDTDREQCFERITALASRIFDVPIALVCLVDLGRHFLVSSRGLGGVREVPRKIGICSHTILTTEDILIVGDTTEDARFRDNVLVTGPPHVRFYAGAPLICPEGYKLGTLCVVDHKPRPQGLPLKDKQTLRELAALVTDAMVQRRRDRMNLTKLKAEVMACTANDLLTPLSSARKCLSSLMHDETTMRGLDDHQRELIRTADSCSDVVGRICRRTIDNFRRGRVDGDDKDDDINSRMETATSVAADKASRRSSLDTPRVTRRTSTDIGGRDDDRGGTSAGPIVLSQMLERLRKVMETYPKRVPIYMTVDEGVPDEFAGDELKVFRSLQNYLTNACKHTEQGSITLRVYIIEYRKWSKKEIVFECEDTGPGVHPDEYSTLFMSTSSSPLLSLTDQRPNEISGSAAGHLGLGLLSVANNITSLGGKFGFCPREDKGDPRNPALTKIKGSIFWFSVPLLCDAFDGEGNDSLTLITKQKPASVNGADIVDSKEKGVPATITSTFSEDSKDETDHGRLHPPMSTNGVSSAQDTTTTLTHQRTQQALVIDDTLVIRKTLDRALSKLGYAVTQACNGLEGLRALEADMYDVVFCDFLMPVMDGIDCVRQYRAWERIHRPWFEQCIVGISAHACPKDVQRAIDVGMTNFLPKPVSLKTLKELPKSDYVRRASKLLDELFEKTSKSDMKVTRDGTDNVNSTKEVGNCGGRMKAMSGTDRENCQRKNPPWTSAA